MALRALFVSACLAAALLALMPGGARAVKAFPKLGLIAGPAPGERFGHLENGSVAVDGLNGHILVADSLVGKVYDFSSATDTHPAVWGGENTPAKSFGGVQVAVAVDDESGDVYVADAGHGVVDKFTASGEFIATVDGSETPAKSFSHPSGGSEREILEGFTTPLAVAVDQATHDLYVLDSGHKVIDVFDATGKFVPSKQITAVPLGLYECGGRETGGIAVDASSGHVFVAEHHCYALETPTAVFEFDATGAPVQTWSSMNAPDFPSAYVDVAVNDTSGDFYVAGTSPQGAVEQYESTGSRGFVAQELGAPSAGTISTGVAVDQHSGDILVSDNTGDTEAVRGGEVRIFGGAQVVLPTVISEPAAKVNPAAATVNGKVDPEAVALSECEFEYVEAAEYNPAVFDPYAEGKTAPCTPAAAEIPADSEEHVVHAAITGLHPATSYHFRLRAANVDGSEFGADEQFSTPPPPALGELFASDETRTSAKLHASIDASGLEATYRFEYGTTAKYGAGAGAGTIPAGSGSVAVAPVMITGLEPDVTYHWRIVATSAAGTSESPDQTFVYDTAGEGLPDGRAYEMVTPPFKNGALLGSGQLLRLALTASEDGTRLMRMSIQCFAGSESCTALRRNRLGTLFQFERTAAGWVTTPLAPRASQAEVVVGWGGNATTGDSLFSVPTAVPGEEQLYLRAPGGSFTDVGPVTEPGKSKGAAAVDQATADGSHIVFQLETGEGWAFDHTIRQHAEQSLYEYSGSGNNHPALVGVTGGPGSNDLISRCSTYFGNSIGSAPVNGYAVSADGRTIFFTAAQCAGGSGVNENVPVPAATLYARIAGRETVKVSERFAPDCTGGCQGSLPAAAVFVGASLDGSRVFFISAQQLNDQASEGGEAFGGCKAAASDCNLYETELGQNASGETVVKDLVAASAGDRSGKGPRVQGLVASAPDGSHVYFVSRAVLTSEERAGCAAGFEAAGVPTEGRCLPSEGANNLYVFERDARYPAGHLAFIATLSSSQIDSEQWEGTGGGQANVTPEGRFLVFVSAAQLTPDDTDPHHAAQVFRYDAATGELLRISIGARGFDDDGNAAISPAAIAHPGATTSGGGALGPARSDPTMSHDGQYVFFMSPAGLTPRALNEVAIGTGEGGQIEHAENVYEYHDGHVYLISDGRDTALESTSCGAETAGESFNSSAVCLIGTDATGRNVFFTTADQLVPSDTDAQLDIYDARICGQEGCIQTPAAQPPCLGEQCHGTPAGTPLVPGVPSASFNGSGNVTPAPAVAAPKKAAAQIRRAKLARALGACRAKREKRRRRACEARAHRAYASGRYPR